MTTHSPRIPQAVTVPLEFPTAVLYSTSPSSPPIPHARGILLDYRTCVEFLSTTFIGAFPEKLLRRSFSLSYGISLCGPSPLLPQPYDDSAGPRSPPSRLLRTTPVPASRQHGAARARILSKPRALQNMHMHTRTFDLRAHVVQLAHLGLTLICSPRLRRIAVGHAFCCVCWCEVRGLSMSDVDSVTLLVRTLSLCAQTLTHASASGTSPPPSLSTVPTCLWPRLASQSSGSMSQCTRAQCTCAHFFFCASVFMHAKIA